MFDPFKKLKLASAFLGVDSPAATLENLDIAELFGRLNLKDLRGMTLQADKLLEQPGVRALQESRYMPPHEPLDKLTDLGDGTLGFEYVRYLRKYKLTQPQIPANLDYGDANTYLTQRVRMTHPILHVVTEYDASPLGELAVQAYYVGQLDNLISGLIISSVLLQITRDSPELLGPALEVTAEAYQRGKAARPFLGIAWEELWSAQVPQLRELIEIPNRTSAVAALRFESAAPAPAPAAPTRSTSSSTYGDDGFAALGRQSASAAHAAASAASSSSSSSSSSTSRGFAGFGSAPAPAPNKPASAPTPAARPSRPPEPPSKLLASFMALAEQEAAHPTPPPAPAAAPPPPPAPPAKPEARTPTKPPPPPPAKPAPPEPGYKVEENTKNITPALSPDDPDYF